MKRGELGTERIDKIGAFTSCLKLVNEQVTLLDNRPTWGMDGTETVESFFAGVVIDAEDGMALCLDDDFEDEPLVTLADASAVLVPFASITGSFAGRTGACISNRQSEPSKAADTTVYRVLLDPCIETAFQDRMTIAVIAAGCLPRIKMFPPTRRSLVTLNIVYS